VRIEATALPDKFIVRRFWSNAEDSYAFFPSGSWAHCVSHKGPFVTVNAIDVPADVLAAYADYKHATGQLPKQDPCMDYLAGGFEVCRRCGREAKEHRR